MAIDLQAFCALPSEERTYMHKPMRVGAWVYATNGHYCVRVPAGDEPEASQSPKRMPGLFEEYAATEFVPMPKLAMAPTCAECNGTGIWHDDELGETDECRACFGRGFEKWHRTRIGDAEFELGYLNKMAALPSVAICTRGRNDPMMLRFDGGEALLMPMKPLDEAKS